jgi:hypothetical protein
VLLESGADPNAANNVSDNSTVVYCRNSTVVYCRNSTLVYCRNSTVEGMWAGQGRAVQCSAVQCNVL